MTSNTNTSYSQSSQSSPADSVIKTADQIYPYYTPTFSYPRHKPVRTGVYMVKFERDDLSYDQEPVNGWGFAHWNGDQWMAMAGNRFDAAKNAIADDTFPSRRRILAWLGLSHEAYEHEAAEYRRQAPLKSAPL